MAQVHPSRAGLVPHEAPARDRDSHRRDSRRDDRDYHSSRRRTSRERSPRRETEERRSRSHERRSRSPARRDGTRERDGQHGSPSRANTNGRNSPSYEAYRAREASGEQNSAQNNWGRVPPRNSAGYNGDGWQRGNGGDFFEERRKRRDAMTINIWPPSPKEPHRELSPQPHPRSKHDKKDKHHSRDKTKDKKRSKHRSRSAERSSKKKYDSDRDRDRKRYDSDRDRKRKRRRSPSTSPSESGSNSDEEERRRRKSRENEREKSYDRDRRVDERRASRSKSHDRKDVDMEEDEDAWVEKPSSMAPPPIPASIRIPTPSQAAATTNKGSDANDFSGDDDDEMDELGPQLPVRVREKIDERSYGGQLLKGEGSAMAAFLQADPHTRIPRRGEIGLTSGEIAKFESVGYVMSGSRHRLMNAVRMRKENQVISAEEKRGILKLQKEERQRREELLKSEFRELVEEKLGSIGAAKK